MDIGCLNKDELISKILLSNSNIKELHTFTKKFGKLGLNYPIKYLNNDDTVEQSWPQPVGWNIIGCLVDRPFKVQSIPVLYIPIYQQKNCVSIVFLLNITQLYIHQFLPMCFWVEYTVKSPNKFYLSPLLNRDLLLFLAKCNVNNPDLINDNGVCRTALAKPGLLKI